MATDDPQGKKRPSAPSKDCATGFSEGVLVPQTLSLVVKGDKEAAECVLVLQQPCWSQLSQLHQGNCVPELPSRSLNNPHHSSAPTSLLFKLDDIHDLDNPQNASPVHQQCK